MAWPRQQQQQQQQAEEQARLYATIKRNSRININVVPRKGSREKE